MTFAASHSALLSFVVARSLKNRRVRYSAQIDVIPNIGVVRTVKPMIPGRKKSMYPNWRTVNWDSSTDTTSVAFATFRLNAVATAATAEYTMPKEDWVRSPARVTFTLALAFPRSEEHTSELQSRQYLVCRLLLEKKKSTVSMVLIASAAASPLKRETLMIVGSAPVSRRSIGRRSPISPVEQTDISRA